MTLTPRRRFLLAFIADVLYAVMAPVVSARAPSGCTSIQDVPVTYNIEFGAAIQDIFNDFDGMNDGCIECHVNPMPAGGLSLEAGISWNDLINKHSADDSSLIYVVPKHPEKSLLFEKVNCDSPPTGERMPLGFSDLSPEQQALIYDWIAEGAPSETTDDIFHNNFDPRGFVQ